MSGAIEMHGELAKLTGDQQRRVTQAIYRAVEESFLVDKKRDGRSRSIKVTADELKRRVNICLKVYKELRGDLDWGLQRAIDHLPMYLRRSLDGVAWEPDQRKVWAPGDGA